MSYADHVGTTSRPSCWGDERAFDPDGDEECAGCRFQHSCRAEIDRGYRGRTSRPFNRSVPIPGSNYRRSTRDDDDVASDYEGGIVGEHETAAQRFIKDGAAGAMRGMFYEFYRFWKRYRIP